MRLDANTIELAAALRKEIELLTDDDEVVRDTLEGEIDLDDVLDHLIEGIGADEALIESIKLQTEQMGKRAQRLKERILMQRGLLSRALTIAGWERRERPLATLSLGKKAPCLGALDDAIIPARFWKQPDPKLDRDALLRALKNGEKIPGAALAEDAVVLHIRRD